MTTLLEVDALSVTFPGRRWPRSEPVKALQGVTLRVEAGEVLAVVGGSGSGKSTLARVLLGLERPSSGVVRLDGADLPLGRMRRSLRKQVQMVFQDPYASLNPVHTVLHHLERPLRLHRVVGASGVRAEAARLLDAVGLVPAEAFLDRHPHELSGGQRQRVAIARALAPRPRLLVADEPTSALDVSVRMGVLELLRALRGDQGLGIVLITHDLSAARFVADRVVVLCRGQLVEEGGVEEVFVRPQHPYTQALVAAAQRRRPAFQESP